MTAEEHEKFMALALRLAKRGCGKVEPNPMVGAVVVREGQIIGQGYHQRFGGPHAEINALDNCPQSPAGATMYVTLEPCTMCGGALFWAQIQRLVFGASDIKKGFQNNQGNILHKKTQISSRILEVECSDIIKRFFSLKR